MRVKPCDIGAEAAERYVAGSMPEPERTSFEDHFFACEDCLQTVQTLDTARTVLASGTMTEAREKAGGTLRGSGRGFPLHWMAAAAALITVVGLSVMMRQGSSPAEVRPDVVAEVPVAAPQVAPSTSPPAPAAAAPAPSTPPAPVRQSNEGKLERWARVVPPQYVALTTRSAQGRDAEEDSRRFDEAMTHYSAGRYREAAEDLQVLAERAPASPEHRG